MPAREGSKARGHRIEAVAGRYLASRGVRIIDRNVYSRGGEIDLIGMDAEVLVFFEVRYRGRGSLMDGAESVTWKKRQRLLKAAAYYIHRHGLWNLQCRIDVVALAPGTASKYQVRWIKNAIQATP